MKITLELLISVNACIEGIEYFKDHCNSDIELKELITLLKAEDKFDYIDWLLTELMNRKQQTLYAIYCAETVLHIFENEYKDDERPRQAIEAAKNYTNVKDICAAADAAVLAAEAAYAASRDYDYDDDTVYAAALAAEAAAFAALAAAADAAALAAADDAEAAAGAVALSADACDAFYDNEKECGKEIKEKMIDYALELLN